MKKKFGGGLCIMCGGLEVRRGGRWNKDTGGCTFLFDRKRILRGRQFPRLCHRIKFAVTTSNVCNII